MRREPGIVVINCEWKRVIDTLTNLALLTCCTLLMNMSSIPVVFWLSCCCSLSNFPLLDFSRADSEIHKIQINLSVTLRNT